MCKMCVLRVRPEKPTGTILPALGAVFCPLAVSPLRVNLSVSRPVSNSQLGMVCEVLSIKSSASLF